MDLVALAQELLAASEAGKPVAEAPSTRDAGFDLNSAYTVEAEIVRIRLAAGKKRAGLKVGYANRAMWRALKLETLVWGHLYDDTVRYAPDNTGTLSLAGMVAPKIEPEIVLKLKQPVDVAGLDAAAVLERTEWIALAFEIIDCPFPDWKFKPVDFVAAYGLHRAEVIGAPQRITAESIPALVEALAGFKLQLLKDGTLVEEGTGKNALKSPALCVAELGAALLKQSHTAPLAVGDLVSTGTLTAGQPVAARETWQAVVEGLSVPVLSVKFLL